MSKCPGQPRRAVWVRESWAASRERQAGDGTRTQGDPMFPEHSAWVTLGFILFLTVEPAKDCDLGRMWLHCCPERKVLYLNYDRLDGEGARVLRQKWRVGRHTPFRRKSLGNDGKGLVERRRQGGLVRLRTRGLRSDGVAERAHGPKGLPGPARPARSGHREGRFIPEVTKAAQHRARFKSRLPLSPASARGSPLARGAPRSCFAPPSGLVPINCGYASHVPTPARWDKGTVRPAPGRGRDGRGCGHPEHRRGE